MASVKLIDVFKTFDGSKYVVDGISADIDNGAFLVIVGPSGCGKTTTLSMIAGLDSVSSGTIIIDGKNVNNVEPKDRNIAMVFQSHSLYPHLTVYGNLVFALKVRRVNKKLIDEKVRKIAIDKKSLFRRHGHPPACLCVSARRQARTGLNERFHGGNVAGSGW